MLYIKISDDWHFQTENHCDLLINKVDSRRIWISGLCGFVPSYLANDQNFEPPLPISSKLPPQTNEIFLEYLPNKNGLLPSLWVERVSGIKKHERDTCSYACGARFFQSFPVNLQSLKLATKPQAYP